MNNEKQKISSADQTDTMRKRSLYDGIRITKKGLDIAIVILSLSLIALFTALLLK